MIQIENVTQEFRTGFWRKRARILNDVSFEVPDGSVFGFLGANGAGKTTLIHLIVGIRRPTQGRVRIGGVSADTREARALLGYMPERPYFHEHLTAEKFLAYYADLSGIDPVRQRSRIADVLEEVGLKHAAKRELSKFSKGMLQRIGIGQAILHDPQLLVLDEPMSGLDPLGRKEIRELILGLAKRGRTVFFSTHVIHDAETICDRVALLQQGRLVGSGKIHELLRTESDEIEVGFSGISLDRLVKIEGVRAGEEIAEGVRVWVEGQEALQRVLRESLKGKTKVLWAHPVRSSLESLFENGGVGSG
jgi:ABC-2 type transport system ATP-binding protein